MRGIRRCTGGVLVVAAVVMAVFAAPASAAITCTRTGSTLDVDMSAATDFPQFSVNSSDQIVVTGVACANGPTVHNVDLVTLDGLGAGQAGQAVINIPSSGTFGPGQTAEPLGISEIEFQINLGDGFDSLQITGTQPDPFSDHLRFGALPGGVGGANLNAPETGGPDGDDLRMTGVESLSIFSGFSETVSNTIDGTGGSEFSGPSTQFINVAGAPGPDTLRAGDGGSTLDGYAGNDLIVAGAGTDTMRGGDDTDTLSYSRATGPVTVSLNTTAFQITGGSSIDTLDTPDIENLTGSPFGDTLTGTNGPNHIDGAASNDSLSLLAGADTFNALDQGPDTVDCGADTDSGVADAVGVDTLTNCENVNFPPETTVAAGPSDGGFTNDPTPVYTLAANEPSSFEYRVDGGSFQPCASDCESSFLSDGEHQITFRATDSTPLVEQTPVTRTVTVDTVLPSAEVTSGPTGLINDPTPTFGFSAEPGASVECGFDGAFGPCSGPGESHTATSVADGERTFQVRATDPAGNQARASRSFRLDTDPPEGTIGKVKVKDDDAKAKIGSDEPGSTLSCRVDKKKFKPCTSPLKVRNLDDGKHKLFVRATDRAGNVDPTPAKKKFEVED